MPIRLAEQEDAADIPATAALSHALGDGQDFELLIAAAPDSRATNLAATARSIAPITHVGELIAEPGLWQKTGNGRPHTTRSHRLAPVSAFRLTDRERLDRPDSRTCSPSPPTTNTIPTDSAPRSRVRCRPAPSSRLIGTLGAGKTRLVQAVAAAVGVPRANVTSPTFVLVNEYTGGRLPIYHFDTYRLKDDDEFLNLGPDEYFDSNGLTFVEWADRVADLLPADRVRNHDRRHSAKPSADVRFAARHRRWK